MGGFSDNIFTRFLYEAPEEDPPDIVSDTGPPDVPDDAGTDDGPPDMGGFDDNPTSDSTDTGDIDDGPPDMGDDFGDGEFGDMGEEDGGDNMSGDEEEKNLELDEKISAVMNNSLYNNYLSLITKVNTQLTSIRNNSDVLYALSEDIQGVVNSLEELDENLRIYIKEKFLNENYSKNKLFYNECLNLLKLINEVFDKDIRKGIKEQK